MNRFWSKMKGTGCLRYRCRGFALLDPLIGMLAIAAVMVGTINFWRLVEYKCGKARIDARVSQILRESIDYVAYVAYDLLPDDGAQLRSGFLLHPLDPEKGRYKDTYPFSIAAAVTTTDVGTLTEAKQIVLTLTYHTSPKPQAADDLEETVRTNAVSRIKG